MIFLPTYTEFINEAAKVFDAGKYEIKDVSTDFAIKYLNNNDVNILSLIPNFKKNFELVKSKFAMGETLRKDMPRLTKPDLYLLQDKLINGELDIVRPFSSNTNVKNPFPEGLSGNAAEDFLSRGLLDGNENDDKTKVRKVKMVLHKLLPIQKQVYFDQVVDFLINYNSLALIEKEITDRYFLVSNDNYILDGHHRFGIGCIINPNMIVNCIFVDLPLSKLLKLSLAFSDAIGNKRNK